MRKQLPLAALSFTASLMGSLACAQTATLSIDPTTQTTTTGNVVTVDVGIANATDLYGYQFDLTFNPSVLSAVSSTEGTFLATGGSTYFIAGTNDNVGGTVSATADSLLTAIRGVNGSGELAVFTFDAIGKGSSALGIDNVILLNSFLGSISSATTGGSVTVTSTTKVPEIDPASAMSGLSLLLGGLAVMRGRRTVKLDNAAA